MRRILTVCAFVAAFSALALAETWTGRLVDATCADQQQSHSATSCNPTSSTTMFAIVVAGGHTYKLDDAGNTKAMDSLKSRADRSANPNMPANGPVSAKVTGTKEGDNILKVDSIEVQ